MLSGDNAANGNSLHFLLAAFTTRDLFPLHDWCPLLQSKTTSRQAASSSCKRVRTVQPWLPHDVLRIQGPGSDNLTHVIQQRPVTCYHMAVCLQHPEAAYRFLF